MDLYGSKLGGDGSGRGRCAENYRYFSGFIGF